MVTGVGALEATTFTAPLRELTPETSLGFEFVDFVKEVLGHRPYPWQEWLAKHCLELLPNGELRFREVLIGVGRQNGKSKFVEWLASWWLYVDSERHPDKISPQDFVVLGVAQVLDIAKKPYNAVVEMVDPHPPTDSLALRVNSDFAELTDKISRTNGDEAIICKSGARYVPRTALNVRGLTTARTIFDELREQKTEDGWAAVTPLGQNIWSSQLYAISSAGDYRSVPLRKNYDKGIGQVKKWRELVETGELTPLEYAAEHDATFGFFWWGDPNNKCPLDEEAAILAANPSIGYGFNTVRKVIAKSGNMSEAKYRQEYLNQWVTADVISYIDGTDWMKCLDEQSAIPAGNRIVIGVDTSIDRTVTWLAAAGYRADGLPHVEAFARRDGGMWVIKAMEQLRDRHGITEVALQSKGCAAVDFIEILSAAGFTIHKVEGSAMGASTGRFKDRIREDKLRHLSQPAIDEAVKNGVTRYLNEVEVWDRKNSVVDISGVVAMTCALYGLEACDAVKEPAKSVYEIYDPVVI